ncbi:DNA phosphorothioation-dependent restriction protein DptH [Bacillus sp. SB49]|nr:DNA phosphorothioation-dependent restriction protein DptH [Bacillus sp. SB49]
MMRNMSNQFFEFIARIINNYFNRANPTPGERYYLRLNNAEDVSALKQALNNCSNSKGFEYVLESGGEYSTTQLECGKGANLVIADTGSYVTNDFLVTLRNRVGDQVDNWQGKALLSIISDDLDSISGGSVSLQSEGMPLHPDVLSETLRENIQEGVSDSTDQIVLTSYLSQIDQERIVQFTTFYDYKELIEIINRKKLSKQDYQNLGMFRDEQLSKSKGNNLDERLNKNKELYLKLEQLNELNQEDEEFARFFLDKDIPKLKKENWKELDFAVVFQSNKARKEVDKGTKVSFEDIKIPTNVSCHYYLRPFSDKGAGKRKYQLLFYTNQPEKLNFHINIDVKNSQVDGLHKNFLKEPILGTDVKVRKRSLEVSFSNRDSQGPLYEKLVYKHEDKASKGAEFNICVLPFEDHIFQDYHSSFEVVVKKKEQYIKLPFDSDKITLGINPSSIEDIHDESQVLDVKSSDGSQYVIPSVLLDSDDRIVYKVRYSETDIWIELDGEKPDAHPIKANRLAKLKREQKLSFAREGTKVTSNGNHAQDYYIPNDYKTFLDVEYQWVDELACAGAYVGGDFIIDEDIKLSPELRNAYNRFVNIFMKREPSIVYWDEKITKRATEYITQFTKEVENMDPTQPAGNKSKGLFKLGTINKNNGEEMWLTPFHPLNVAFELRKLVELRDEQIDQGILDRLKPDGLLPYIFGEQEVVYSPDSQENIPGWMVYKGMDTSNVADADLYLDKVVKDKLQQFEEHFSYLFLKNSKAPVKVNIINILNDYRAIRGLLQWYLDKKNKQSAYRMPALIVNVYRNHSEDSFCEKFAETRSVHEFEEVFNLKLKSNDPNLSSEDLLEELHQNIKFYVGEPPSIFEYAHISFYKMESQKQFASQPMDQLESGVSMKGLYTTVPAKKHVEDYRSGFGIMDYKFEEDDLLIKCAYYLNELASNMDNPSNTYDKGRGIVACTTLDDLHVIQSVLQSSNWVTFIDPGVDLDFFENTVEGSLVIHYNDQYSSSSRYDAITVTSSAEQYYDVIREFLASINITSDDRLKTAHKAISGFNTINGEWLLKILGNRGYFTEEKLSILAAIKTALAYFNHEDILWVPVSLEEVLRVAGAVSLNKSGGIFTAKNLGVSGKHSDDVLLIGLEQEDNGVKIHLYPIEVKIGHNHESVINKAREQLEKTSSLLKSQTIDREDSFIKRFYQNFFVQLFTSNAKRITQTKFFHSKNYELQNELTERLKKGEYDFVNSLDSYIGKGAVISFKKGTFVRTNEIDSSTLLLEMSKEDDLKPCIVEDVEELEDWLTNASTDFNKDIILKYSFKGDKKPEENVKEKIFKFLTE